MTLVDAERLDWPPASRVLSFSIRPGLTFIRGGEGRGKSTLLGLLAGAVDPASGIVRRSAETIFFESPADPVHDRVVAGDWLASLRPRYPAWDADIGTRLVASLGLSEHIAKPMYMLSTGSRRKVGLVGAAASRADLTLLDTPYAALDAASCRVLTQWLRASAACTDRAWVIADYEVPAGLADIALSGLIDLGD